MLQSRIFISLLLIVMIYIFNTSIVYSAISIETATDTICVKPSFNGTYCYTSTPAGFQISTSVGNSVFTKKDFLTHPSFALNIAQAVKRASANIINPSINKISFFNMAKVDEKPVISIKPMEKNLIFSEKKKKNVIYRNFHRVRPGQSLWLISKMYGYTVGDLKKVNNLNKTALKVNQKIYLPDSNYKELAQKRESFLVGKKVTPNVTKMGSKNKRIYKASSKWPLLGKYRFSSAYGMRLHPLFKKWKFHNGVDLAARKGTLIIAPAAGKIIFAGWKAYSGRTVMIEHISGYTSIYCHCSKISVKKGQMVVKGQKLAAVGRTGSATGSHLHFSIKKGNKYCNPVKTIASLNRL